MILEASYFWIVWEVRKRFHSYNVLQNINCCINMSQCSVSDHSSRVSYKYLIMIFIFLPQCLGNSCNSNISSNILPNGKSTWKLCINTYDRSLQLKIKSLFLVSSKFPEWITIGFPLNGLNTDNYDISFFLLEVTGPKSYNVKVCLCGA